MRGFAGFPAGGMKFTPLPNLFFSAVLPQIDNLAELKVTMHIFWMLHQKKGFPRYVTLRELSEDGTLISGLKKTCSPGEKTEDKLREALELATTRGTLLHLFAEIGGKEQDLYLLNTANGREVVRKLRNGELDMGQIIRSPGEPVAVRPERPNIFALYEQNVGLLTPIIADELREAEKVYPAEWIEDAFKQAVEYNKRNWKYIQRILERWAIEGKSDEKSWRSNKQIPDQRKY
ncbi:MAG: DnaD domain protein [Chloroflexi bacterium]|nr:DnaD domain protein [Chloroflexota bacterium]MDA8186902.1 DnaD domain protein [Dehalococcoidales bacterium]